MTYPKVASSEQQAASVERHAASRASRIFPLAPRSSLLTPPLPSDFKPQASSLKPVRRLRRAVSLLEVLIAMFVMLFGLMGVAAIMPVGNHYAARSERYDRGGALAASAFAELKSRGLLQPDHLYHPWIYANYPTSATASRDSLVMQPAQISGNPNPNVGRFNVTNTSGPGHAFVIDAVGSADADPAQAGADFFPVNANGGLNLNEWRNPSGAYPPPALAGDAWPIRRITITDANGAKMTSRVADSIFRLRDDLAANLPDANDHPGIQRWETVDNNPANGSANNTPDYPADDTLLARAYAGSYSWLATVVPVNTEALLGLQPSDPRYGSFLYEVSVAVFRKRDDAPSPESERILPALLDVGGNLELYSNTGPDDQQIIDDALLDVRNRDWIALAGVNPATGTFILRWRRLSALEEENNEDNHSHTGAGADVHRNAMLENIDPNDPLVGQDLRAILVPNVIGVATQTLKLETN